MKNRKVLALTKDGKMTYCTASPENVGKGRCNHLDHQGPEESESDFLVRISEKITEDESYDDEKSFQNTNLDVDSYEEDDYKEITQEEIDDYASKIDEIAGTHVTPENLEDVLNTLSLEQVEKITNIGFETAPMFSLPITDENFEEKQDDNRIYFAELGEYGIAGNTPAIEQIFGSVGEIAKVGGGAHIVKKSYLDGIGEEDQFHDILSARDSQIQKSVSTSKPGAAARLAFYGMSDVSVIEDCGSKEENGNILSCLAPEGNICKKCAKKTQGGQVVDNLKYVGGWVATNLSEPLVTMQMKFKHAVANSNDKKKNSSSEIIAAMGAQKNSEIINKTIGLKTTEEKRKVLFEGFKEAYIDAGKPVDDFNTMTLVKKMTSYNWDENGEELPIKDPKTENCIIRSMKSLGLRSNVFKKSELQTSYKFITTPHKGEIKPDSAMELDR